MSTTEAGAPGDGRPQTYRIEVRFDVTGTQHEAEEAARRAAALLDGDVTAIFDEDWDEIGATGTPVAPWRAEWLTKTRSSHSRSRT